MGGNIMCGMAGRSGTERRRGTSAYKRLYRELRDALEGGEFREGRRMPTEAELCRQYGVSRHTVRQAFQDLVAEGLVYRVPGRGTFATSLSEHGRYLRSIGTVEDLMVWSDTNVELLRPISFEEDEGVARLLELPTPEVSVLVMRRHYDGLPFALTRVYLSPGLGKRLAEKDVFARTVPNATVIAAIEPLLPHPIAGASQEVTAKPAPRRRGWHDRVRPRRAEPARPTPLLRHPRDPRRARRLLLSPRAVLLPYRAAPPPLATSTHNRSHPKSHGR